MELECDTYRLTIIFHNHSQLTKVYQKNNSLNDLFKELCWYYKTNIKNLMKYVEIWFNGEKFKDFYWEISFEELIQKKKSVVIKINHPYNCPLETKTISGSSKLNKLSKNLCNYIFEFFKYKYTSQFITLNKRLFSIIMTRKLNLIQGIIPIVIKVSYTIDWKNEFTKHINISKIREFTKLKFDNCILQGFKYFYEGIFNEFGIEIDQNLENALILYKQGAVLNNIYCLLRLYYIYSNDYEKFKIREDNNLSCFAFLKLYAFQNCLIFTNNSIVPNVNLIILTNDILKDLKTKRLKEFFDYFVQDIKEKKILKYIFFSLIGENKEKYFYKIICELQKNFSIHLFLFYFSIINRENSETLFYSKTQTIYHFYLKYFNEIFCFLKESNIFIKYFVSNTYFYDYFALLNYDFYDFMKLIKKIDKKDNSIYKLALPFYTSGNNFILQYSLIDDKLIKLLTYIIHVKTLYKEKKYDTILEEVLQFIEMNSAEFHNNFGSLYYLLVKIYWIKRDYKKVIEYSNKLNVIYIDDATYNSKCSYYIARCIKLVKKDLNEYTQYLKNGLTSFILRINITQLYYYSFLCFRALKKEDHFLIKSLKKINIKKEDLKEFEIRSIEFDNRINYKNFLLSVLYVNSVQNPFLLKVVTYEKKVLNGKIILFLYVEKMNEKYFPLVEYCSRHSAKEKSFILIKLTKSLYNFHKKGIIINNLSPKNIHISIDFKFKFDVYTEGFNSTGIDFLNPVEKYGKSIRYQSRSMVLFNITEYLNDYFSLVMIFYRVYFEEDPWKIYNNNEIINHYKDNSDFFEYNKPESEGICSENKEIIETIIRNIYNFNKTFIFHPLIQNNYIIDELKKII